MTVCVNVYLKTYSSEQYEVSTDGTPGELDKNLAVLGFVHLIICRTSRTNKDVRYVYSGISKVVTGATP